MTADTRKDKRANVQLKVRYKSATVDEFIEQYAVDISRGGIFIKQKAPMPIGTLLKFEFQLKDESRLIHGVGRVVWRREEGSTEAAGMGIKFIKMDPESKVLVERIVDARGAAPAAYEAGGGDAGEVGAPAPAQSAPPKPRYKQTLQFDAAALKSGDPASAGGFFPSTSSEADLPPVEDRTQVRHASEFLASALGSAGIDSEASREAELRAEEARKRSAEIERERAEADAAKKASADATEAARREAEDHAEAEKRAAERATAEKNAAVEKTAAAARAAAQPEKAAPEKAAPEKAAPEKAAPVAVSKAGKAATAAKKDEPARSSVRPQPLKVPSLPPPPAPREEPRSMMLPIVGTVLVLGAVAVWWFTRTPEATGGEVATTTETPLTEEDAGAPAVAEGVEDAGVAELVAGDEPVDAGPPAAPVVMAQVRIESTPSGAQVLLGTADRGVTPLALDLPVGTAASLTLRMAGYTALTHEVTPREGTNAPVRVALASLPFSITVETTPPGARVSGGGRTIVSPGTLTFDRPRGPVTVTASKNNFTNAVRTLTLPDFTETAGSMQASVSLTLAARAAPAGGVRRPPGETPPAGGGETPPAGGGETPPPANPPPANPPPANPPPANPPPGDPLPDNPFG